MTEINSITSATGIKLGVGPYAYSDPTIWPDWYLAHMLAGVADPKWETLTKEQQAAVQAENLRRNPKSEVEAKQEAETRAITAASAANLAASEGVAPAADAPAVDASASHTRESDETILSGTVVDAADYISKVTNTTELDALKAVEEAGKNRTGVLDAIEKRRVSLTVAASAAAATPPAVTE